MVDTVGEQCYNKSMSSAHTTQAESIAQGLSAVQAEWLVDGCLSPVLDRGSAVHYLKAAGLLRPCDGFWYGYAEATQLGQSVALYLHPVKGTL